MLELKKICNSYQCVITKTNIYLAVATDVLPLNQLVILGEKDTSKDTTLYKSLLEINKIATEIAIYLSGGVV